MHSTRKSLSIRPRQPLSLLPLAGLLLAGMVIASRVYGHGAWLFGAAFVALCVGLAGDRIVFNGERLRRTGPGAWLGAQLGWRRELAAAEIETIATQITKREQGALVYRTTICGGGARWQVKSTQAGYSAFLKALFGSVGPMQLDPLSSELKAYARLAVQLDWTQQKSAERSAARWQRLANALTLEGQFDAAARYFRLAYERNPKDAALHYEIARAFRKRALFGEERHQLKSASCDLRRARVHLRLAGRLAQRNQDAALIERIGETFFESGQLHHARRSFERAALLDPQRLRASIGLAGIALKRGQAAAAIHHYGQAARAATEAGLTGLAEYTQNRAEYYQRLLRDDDFLSHETTRQSLLTQLKWARRTALLLFLATWLIHLAAYRLTTVTQAFSRELSATAVVMWIFTVTASHLLSQRSSRRR